MTLFAMAARINARLNDELAASLAETMRLTHKSVTEIVSEALVLYCESATKRRRGTFALLQAMGFVGSGRGPRDLSRNHKKHLTASLSRKT